MVVGNTRDARLKIDGVTTTCYAQYNAVGSAGRLDTTIVPSLAKHYHPEGRQNREDRGHCLSKSDCARDGRAAQHDGGQEAQFNAVRLAVLLAITTKGV